MGINLCHGSSELENSSLYQHKDNDDFLKNLHLEKEEEEQKKKKKQKRAFLHFVDDQSRHLYVFSIVDHLKFKFKILLPNLVPIGFDSTIMDNYVYMCGGVDPDTETYLDSTFQIAESLKELIKRPIQPYNPDNVNEILEDHKNEVDVIEKGKMLIAKSFHCLVTISRTEFFSIGGNHSHLGDLSNCELFSYQVWKTMPSLTESKCGVSACKFNDYVYCFGGEVNSRYIKTIERLKVKPETYVWEKVQLEKEYKWTPRSCSGSIQVSAHKIMIFGGTDAEGKKSDSFIFNSQEMSLAKISSELRKDEIFIQRKPGFYHKKNKIYIIGNSERDIHAFKKQWVITDTFARQDFVPASDTYSNLHTLQFRLRVDS